MDNEYKRLLEHYRSDKTLVYLMNNVGMECFKAGIRHLLWVLKTCWMSDKDYRQVMFGGTDCFNEDDVVQLLTCYEEVDDIANIVEKKLTEGIRFPVSNEYVNAEKF